MPNVLVVDDETHTTNLMTTALDMMGYEATAANSGDEALRLLADEAPDVILLDYMMPELDGVETLQRIRALPNGEAIPVIMITAFPEEELKRRVTALGAVGFLAKPLSFDSLELALAELAPPAVAP